MVIAMREYGAAVKSKAFIISLFLMPLMMFGGIIVQKMTQKISDVKTKRIAVVDRTTDEVLVAALDRAATARNENRIFDDSGKQNRPRIEIVRIEPAKADDRDAVMRQRLELSDRVRNDEFFAFLEIGPNVLKPLTRLATTRSAEDMQRAAEMSWWEKMEFAQDAIPEDQRVRYATNRPTNAEVRGFLQQTLNEKVYQLRMQEAGLPFAQVMPLLMPPQLQTHGLTKRQATGEIVDASRQNEVMNFLIPLALLILMFMIIMVGASPLTGNMIEEKQLRISEVLLGSVRPFELMMGKLLGGVGVALTLAAIYFVGVYMVARQYDVVVSPAVIGWFLFFTILATLMYGALFVAAGSAVTNIKEAQSMITPVILLVVLPMFILESLLRDPSGIIATIGSFFPTSAPMVTIARIAIPPGIPLWQTLLSALVTVLTTVAVVWAAGRIFRVGILMQGQGAKVGEMLKWVVRG
jgi:ABC-type Na+ efflux pump permease subunit